MLVIKTREGEKWSLGDGFLGSKLYCIITGAMIGAIDYGPLAGPMDMRSSCAQKDSG